MSVALLVVGPVVVFLFMISAFSFSKQQNKWRLLQLFGAACLLIVVTNHVAEAFHIFPAMGWGPPNTAGHYLDLISAILGLILFPLGFVLAR